MRKANYSKPPIELKNLPDMLKVEEVCLVMRMSRPTILKMLKNGEVKAEKYGREWRVFKSQFEK